MLRIDPDQAALVAQRRFMQKLDAALARSVPEFGELPSAERLPLLAESLEAAAAAGLRSEQGLAAYVLAAAFIGPGFESRSAMLRRLLAGPLPEARRIHALNSWARATAAQPQDPAAADAVLAAALQRTAPPVAAH